MADDENCVGSSLRVKSLEIEAILSEDEVDLWALREHCLTSGGLINDSIRKKAWPKLVGVDFLHDSFLSSVTSAANDFETKYIGKINVVDPSSIASSKYKKRVMARCLDSRQIDLDIARCTWHLLNGSQRSRRRQMRNKHKKKIATLLKKKQRRLGNLINLVLIQSYATSLHDFDDKRLRYYQGFHDIASICLSVLGGVSSPHVNLTEKENYDDGSSDLFEQSVAASKVAKTIGLDVPSRVLLQISQSHLSDIMKSNFDAITSALRLIIMPLIAVLDKEVHDHLQMCGMEPFFCFPWIITWFSHDIRNTSLVKRLFDMFIVSHPLMPIYVSIAMLLHPYNREEVLGTECDFASLHKTLTQLPRNSCSVGWKFVGNQFGGGYVSADEEDESKISLESASLLSSEMDRESMLGDELSLAPSLASDSIISTHDISRVPIQELIDLSIKFMRRIPPRNLPKLARGYRNKTGGFAAILNTSSINLFHQPPPWTIRASAPSEREVKVLLRKKEEIQVKETHENNDNHVTEKMYPRAAIASGMGPDGEKETRRRQWKRRRIKISAVAISLVAITLGLVGHRNEQILSSRTFTSSTKKILDTFVIQHTKRREEQICMDPNQIFPYHNSNEVYQHDNLPEAHQNNNENTVDPPKEIEIMESHNTMKKSRSEPIFRPGKLIRALKRSLSDEAEVILF